MKLNKQQREQLKQKFGGRCAYCGDVLPDRWHADHIEPIKRTAKYDKDKYMFVYDGGCERPENNHIDNFNPSCPSCNIIKHANTLEGFRKIIGGFITSLNRDSTQYKFAKRYGLLEEREVDVKFYYERI